MTLCQPIWKNVLRLMPCWAECMVVTFLGIKAFWVTLGKLTCLLILVIVSGQPSVLTNTQNPPAFDRLLNRVRERIETSFCQLQNTRRFLEPLLAKTVLGLVPPIIAKVSALTLPF